MAIRAFLLCGDEKAVHAVTQILDELEVSFEHSSEPPFALKRLSTQRFDLLIVDCDNAQNATQVFNSARASNLNKAFIAIAIVEGKAGVPNAFRLGASLVLTKPVSLEQARNTLRTGIGMARKDTPEVKAAVPAVAPVAATTPLVPLVPVAPVPGASAPAFSGPAPVVTTPAIPPSTALTPVAPVASTPAPVVPVSVPKPAATFAAVALTPAPAAPASVAPVNEKPAIAPKPAVTPAPPAQEHKTALTDFTVPDLEEKPKPTVGVTAFAKAAAASTATTPSAGKLDPVRKEAASPSEDLKSKAKPVLTKADTEDTEESEDAKLSISDPLAEEEETLDPLKDYGVPSFGGLGKQPFAGVEKTQRSGGKGLLIAAVVLALIGGGGYAGWIMQPAFRDFATGEYGKANAKIAEYRGEPETTAAAKPQPSPTPLVPAPAPAVPPITPAPGSEEIDISMNPTSTPATEASTTPASVIPAANPPQISSAVVDSKTQKGAAVQGARQDASRAANPALVPASLPPTTTAKSPSSDLLEVPEDFADDQVIHRVHPVYPKQARVHKLQGTVVLEAIVNKQGKVDSLQLVSGDPVLAAAAADAVKLWRYKPYMHNGDFTDFQTRVTVDFKIPVSNP
jgi:protein TonB